MSDKFNVDAGVRQAPNFTQGSGGFGANIDVGSSIAQTFGNVGSLFAGINDRLSQANRNNIRANVFETGSQVREGSLDPQLPANPDANRGPATGPGSNNVGNNVSNNAGSVSTTVGQVEGARPVVGGTEVPGPMPAVAVTQRTQELQNHYAAFQQGRLSKANYYSMMDAAFRSDVIRLGRQNAEAIAKDYKTLFGYAPGDYIKAVDEANERKAADLKDEEKRWLGVEQEALSHGISQDEVIAARQDPGRRLDIERRTGAIKSEVARRDMAIKELERDEKLGKLDQERVYEEALKTQHNFVTGTFSEISNSVENKTGVSIAEFTKKRQQAMADGVIDAKEAQELTAFANQLKVSISQARLSVMGPFEAKIKDRTRVSQLRSEFDGLVKEWITDPIENGNTGVLAVNKKILDSAQNGDAFSIMQQSENLRRASAARAIGGDTVANSMLNELLPGMRKDIQAAPLKGISNGISTGKPLSEVLQKNTDHLKPEDKASVINNTLGAIHKTLVGNTASPETKMLIAETMFGEGNSRFSEQFKPESKAKMFSLLVNPEMSKRMEEVGKTNPKALESYQKWSYTTFENVFQDSMRNLSNNVFPFKDGSVKTPSSERVLLGFDGSRFTASVNTNFPESQLTRPITYGTVDPASKAMVDNVNKINKALEALESVPTSDKNAVTTTLDRMFASANVSPNDRNGLAAIASAYNESKIAGGRTPTKEGGSENNQIEEVPSGSGSSAGGTQTSAVVPDFNEFGERTFVNEQGQKVYQKKLPNGDIHTQAASSEEGAVITPSDSSSGNGATEAPKAVDTPLPPQRPKEASQVTTGGSRGVPASNPLGLKVQSEADANQNPMTAGYIKPTDGSYQEKAIPATQNDKISGAGNPYYRSDSSGSGSSDVSVSGSFMRKVASVESGGNSKAKNSSSSATGLYQFIEGTWKKLMKKYPNLGLTADGRTDPEQQRKAMEVFTQENESTLRRAGLPVSEGTLYLAHFAGAGGAKKLLMADWNTPVDQLMDSGAIRANKFLEGKTAGWVIQWAEKKMNKR